MKKFFSTSPLGLVSILLFSTVIFYYACRKLDRHDIGAPKDNTERFFKTSPDIHPAVQKVVDVMRKINNKKKFVNKFVEKQGFALWNKAKVFPIRGNTASKLEASDYAVIIPMVWDTKPQVHSAIAAKVTSDSVYFTVMDGSNYAAYNADSASKGLNGRELSLTLMFLDHDVFGHAMYQINDSACYPFKGKKAELVQAPDSVVTTSPGTARMEIVSITVCTVTAVPPHEGQVTGCAPDDLNCNGYVNVYDCVTYTIMGDGVYGQDGNDPAPPSNAGDGGGGSGGNDYCRDFPGTSHNCGAGDPPGWTPLGGDDYTPYNPLTHDSVTYTRELKDSFPCLYHLLKDSLQNGNMLAQVLGVNLFNDSTEMHITFSISDSATTQSQAAAYTHSGVVFVNGTNISQEKVSIEFNPYYMKHGTKEFMLSVALHELFHLTFNLRWGQYQFWLTHPYTMYDSAWMKQHYPIFWYYEMARPAPSNEIASHEALAGHYADTIANIMRPFYNKAASTATRDTALKALSFGGLLQSTAWKLLPSLGIDTCKYRAMMISAQNSQTDNSSPTGCASSYHYNYNTDLKLTPNCN